MSKFLAYLWPRRRENRGGLATLYGLVIGGLWVELVATGNYEVVKAIGSILFVVVLVCHISTLRAEHTSQADGD